MKRIIRAVICLLFFGQVCYGKEIELKPLNLSAEKDRILILAPHPDDEAIGAAGVIQKAVQENIPFKIVYLTYGDNNGPSFIVNQKRLVFRRKAVLMMGQLRGQEAIQGMESLGVKKDQLVFLGYPDWGTENIFTSFWGDKKPFRSMLTRVRQVPYQEALSPGSPYLGESILKDLKKIIQEFQPTKIFVSHPLDRNRDHRALFLYLQVALWDLNGQIVSPDVYGYLIHWNKWPLPRGNNPQLSIVPPKDWPEKDTVWFSLVLDENSLRQKQKAISFYKTQVGYNPPFLYTFARKNELFTSITTSDLNRLSTFNLNDSVAYTKDNEFIYVKLTSNYWNKEANNLRMFFIGYKKGIPFEQMPKIRVDIMGQPNKISAYDKGRYVYLPEVKSEIKSKGKELCIKIPIKDLNDPEFVLTSLDIRNVDLREEGGWHLMKLTNMPVELASRAKKKIIHGKIVQE